MIKAEFTKEQILKAAENCPAAKETLKVLFQDVFSSPNIEIKFRKQSDFQGGDIFFDNISGIDLLAVRCDGEHRGKAFWLSSNVDWEITREKFGPTILIPTIKKYRL